MPAINNNNRVEAARRYAAANASDPFAYARILTHMRNGVASYTEKGQEAFYDATPEQEVRSFTINSKVIEYYVTTYKNIRRP